MPIQAIPTASKRLRILGDEEIDALYGVPVQSMQKVPISCARKIKGLEEQAGYFAKQINGLLPL
jgi:hypothetical protein